MKPALEAIARTIAKHGHHVYIISGTSSPRFSYTIGLTESLGAELILAGAACFDGRTVLRIVNEIAAQRREGAPVGSSFKVKEAGTFRLRKACPEWCKALMLGAFDYYAGREIEGYQIVPDARHTTRDVPNLAAPWSAATEPVWTHYFEPWPFAVPAGSIAATHLVALRGARITQAVRWEEDIWEMFAGDSDAVKKKDLCPVPLGVMLGIDPTLRAVVDLAIGSGLVRDDAGGPWQP